jgi:NADH-quinone oxidoreductase subunit F
VEQPNPTAYDPESDPVPYPRETMRMIPVEKRRNNFDEVEQSWNESETVRQARRCLRCDYGKCPVCEQEDAHA